MNNKIAILVLMPYWHVNFEKRLFKLVEILRMNYKVYFCVLTSEMARRKEIYAPAVPKERLLLQHFLRIDAKPINSLKDLRRYLLKSNFVISGTTKGLQKVSDMLSMFRLPYILINDIGDSTPFTYGQDILALPGEAFRKNTVFNKSFLEDQVFISGDIRFDSINDEILESEKEEFFNKYKLDKKRKFAVFCTGAFQRIYGNEWLKELYKKIVSCIKKNNFDVLIRLHQNDYAGHKRPANVKTTSNLLLFPEIGALEPWDIRIAMRLCAFMVAVESSVVLEASVYRKNAVVVNLHEYSLLKDARERNIFPKRRFNGFGLRFLYKGKDNMPIQAEFLDLESSPYRTKGLRITEYDWIGADCNIEELDEVLKSPDLFQANQDLCDKHIEKYWHKIDGNASLRIAERVKELIADPMFKGRIFMPKGIRIFNSLVYTAKKFIEYLVMKIT